MWKYEKVRNVKKWEMWNVRNVRIAKASSQSHWHLSHWTPLTPGTHAGKPLKQPSEIRVDFWRKIYEKCWETTQRGIRVNFWRKIYEKILANHTSYQRRIAVWAFYLSICLCVFIPPCLLGLEVQMSEGLVKWLIEYLIWVAKGKKQNSFSKLLQVKSKFGSNQFCERQKQKALPASPWKSRWHAVCLWHLTGNIESAEKL